MGQVLIRNLDDALLTDYRRAVDGFFTETTDSLDLLDEALGLAIKLGHGVHDCLYLALALRHDIPVVTHDAKVAHAAQRAGFAENVELLT